MQDERILKPLEIIIKKIFHEDYNLIYEKNDNQRLYTKVIINRNLTQREKILLNNRINSDDYHLEIKEENEPTIITVYPKLNLNKEKMN